MAHPPPRRYRQGSAHPRHQLSSRCHRAPTVPQTGRRSGAAVLCPGQVSCTSRLQGGHHATGSTPKRGSTGLRPQWLTHPYPGSEPRVWCAWASSWSSAPLGWGLPDPVALSRPEVRAPGRPSAAQAQQPGSHGDARDRAAQSSWGAGESPPTPNAVPLHCTVGRLEPREGPEVAGHMERARWGPQASCCPAPCK